MVGTRCAVITTGVRTEPRGDGRVRTEQQSYCARCGALLRRRSGPRGQTWCDPCRRIGPDPRRDLPSGFYFQDPIATALGEFRYGISYNKTAVASKGNCDEPERQAEQT